MRLFPLFPSLLQLLAVGAGAAAWTALNAIVGSASGSMVAALVAKRASVGDASHDIPHGQAPICAYTPSLASLVTTTVAQADGHGRCGVDAFWNPRRERRDIFFLLFLLSPSLPFQATRPVLTEVRC